jgi:hypothetical protein
VIELDDGCRVFVQNTALRLASLENSQRIMSGQPVNPDEIYFRCQPKLEATVPQWDWLSEASSRHRAACARRRVFEFLPGAVITGASPYPA